MVVVFRVVVLVVVVDVSGCEERCGAPSPQLGETQNWLVGRPNTGRADWTPKSAPSHRGAQ